MFAPMARIVAALFALALLAEPAQAARSKRRPPRPASTPGKVVILGSSSMNGSFGDEIVRGLRRLGYTAEKQGKSSSGFARPDYYDWHGEIAKLDVDKHTVGALIYLGTNDGQAIHLRPAERRKLKFRRSWLPWSNPAWPDIYAKRVSAFARALCARGVHRVAILTPVDVVDARLSGRLRQVRRGLARGAKPVPCARAFSGRGDLRRILRQARRRRLKAKAGKRHRRSAHGAKPEANLRQPDGTHLTRHGARVVWNRVEKNIQRWISRGPVPKPRKRRPPRAKRRQRRPPRGQERKSRQR